MADPVARSTILGVEVGLVQDHKNMGLMFSC